MLLIALLLVALACIVVGVVLASAPWFIGSLVASVVAGYLLWRQRDQVGTRPDRGQQSAATGPPRQTSLVTGTAFAGKLASDADAQRDLEVWVVDGKPNYHTRTCSELAGESAEAVPLVQAAKDGFAECPTCRPSATADAEQVWVIDGRPDYHTADCERLSGLDAEPIPRSQAIEDGFRRCPDCRPDGARMPRATPAARTEASGRSGVADPASTVWVVGDRPRYHLEDCLIIKGQDAAPTSIAQATEDGLMPCSMCEPNVTRV